MLGIHFNTVRKYSEVAYACIEPYEQACQINSSGQLNRHAPLSLYQVWVIYMVKQLFDAIPHGFNRIDIVSDRLLTEEKTAEIFSPNNFSRDLPNFLAKINQQAA